MAIFRNTRDSTTINVNGQKPFEPGETRELDEDAQEDFEFYIERGDIVEAGEPSKQKSEEPEDEDNGEEQENEDGSDEETPEQPGESDEVTVEDQAFAEQVKGLKYIDSGMAAAITQDFESFEDFAEDVDQSYLENFDGIGPSKAQEIMEQLG